MLALRPHQILILGLFGEVAPEMWDFYPTFTRLKDEMTSQALPSTNTAYGTAVIYGRSDSHHFSWAGAGSYHTCILILFIETAVGTYYRSRVVPHPKPGKNPKQIIGGNSL